MLIKLQSSWQELILNFLLTETLLDRSKLKLLKTFCLFTFFFLRELPKCNIFLCFKLETGVQIAILPIT